jgi:hypothetical protein
MSEPKVGDRVRVVLEGDLVDRASSDNESRSGRDSAPTT